MSIAKQKQRADQIEKFSVKVSKRSDAYVSVNWAIICSDRGLLPVRCQSITETIVDFLLIGPLGSTNFVEK